MKMIQKKIIFPYYQNLKSNKQPKFQSVLVLKTYIFVYINILFIFPYEHALTFLTVLCSAGKLNFFFGSACTNFPSGSPCSIPSLEKHHLKA